MDTLWAPWRLAYVATEPKTHPAHPCFICQGIAENQDRNNWILHRTNHSTVVLNRFPYNNGHLLVAPLAHKAHLQEFNPDETLDLQQTLTLMVSILEQSIHPEGFNIGLNLGKVAGAGLPGHLHWHIVPRWNGDTNFMPVLSDTKVIPQSLEALYDLLRGKLDTVSSSSS